MTERFLHQVRVERPAADETADDARRRLAALFPRTALRRMTHLGLLVGAALDGLPLGPDDAVVYASTYAETRALEDYLTGFPAASPLLFQTSIHPGGIQQVLIGRQQPVARLWPLAGRARLVEHALQTALVEPAPRVVLVGGEERGRWLLEHQMASARSFAFALGMSRDPAGAVARVWFEPTTEPTQPGPSLEEFVDALAGRAALRWVGVTGTWALEWLPTAAGGTP